MTNSQSTPYDSDSWTEAQNLAKALDPISGFFSSAVRVLVRDHLKNNGQIRPITKYQVARLLKLGSFKGMFYLATKDLMSERLAEHETVSIGQMIDMYQPFDIAALLSSFVLFRRNRKKLGEDNWLRLESSVCRDSKIGSNAGIAIPGIGIGPFLLISVQHHMSRGIFIKKDSQAFDKYLDHLLSYSISSDPAFEHQHWGCSASQVGVILLSKMGFGVETGEAYTAAFDQKRKIGPGSDIFQIRMKMAKIWIEALLTDKDEPEETIPSDYYPMKSAREPLKKRINEARQGIGKHWLRASRDDVNPEATPQLYPKQKQSAAENNLEVPDELSEIFSIDQITKMEEEDFDDLVDQMDLENEGKAAMGSEVVSTEDMQRLDL